MKFDPRHSEGIVREILTERIRQVEKEGWTPDHDDSHSDKSLPKAAACYVLEGVELSPPVIDRLWPWERSFWKPSHRRRNLVKAAALIVAEIERIDRSE